MICKDSPNEMSRKYDCYLDRQSIKGPAVAFADQLKIAHVGLEKDLYLPYADILEMPTIF